MSNTVTSRAKTKNDLILTTRLEITRSWEHCRKNSLNPRSPVLPDTNLSPSAMVNFREKEELFIEISDGCRKIFDLLLPNSKVAVFYADPNLNVVIQYGNEQLLHELNSLNLRVGTNLSEDVIGTNAAALASFSKNKNDVVGSEHFLEVMHGFAGKAAPLLIAGHVPIAYIMLMLDIRDYDTDLSVRLDHLIDLQNHLLDVETNNLELSLQKHMLELGIDSRETGAVFLNEHGLIIQMNEWLENYLSVAKRDFIGKFLSEVFPEISAALPSYPAGEPSSYREIIFHDSNGQDSKLLMQCTRLKNAGGNSGMYVTLAKKKSALKESSKKPAHDAHFTFKDLIGTSDSFCEAKNIAEVASVSNCNIIIIGESGSGKELFAQSIHNRSSRQREPFISINCAAIPKDLISSELFGYVEGAFTGAKKSGAPGKFELANKGTLFLDEIAEIPTEMQAVLLRVLENDSVSRLGSSVSIPIDVRVITATNRDICASVASGAFRLDLYHRLCTVRIDIAPLRRRKEDIPILANYFLRLFNFKHNKNIRRITPETIQFMQNCLWLGNVRELRNVIERGVIFCASQELDVADLPKELLIHHKSTLPKSPPKAVTGDGVIQKLFQDKMDEKYRIDSLLKKHNHNKTLVAQELGITRATLYRRLKLLGIADD